MKNYKNEIKKFIKIDAYDAQVSWDLKLRLLEMKIVGKDGSILTFTGKDYAELEIKKNFKVYLTEKTSRNFCK